MSPEQAEMSQLDVDTRSDIYSLAYEPGVREAEQSPWKIASKLTL
jgi:hypothetical protein